MFDLDINLWSVVAAAIVYFVIGAIWYSPLLFAKPWMKAVGKTEKELREGDNMSQYVASFLLILVLCYVLAHMVQFIGAVTFAESVTAGIWLWAGFVATTMAINSLYAGWVRDRVLIDGGYHLVGMVAAAVTLTAWL